MAAKDSKEFVHESLQDRSSLVQYLGALSEGLQNGRLRLSSNGQQLELLTPGLVKLDVQAKLKRARGQIVLKNSWKNQDAEPQLQVAPLTIETPAGPDTE